jgi:GT2 family glycosyltransferase
MTGAGRAGPRVTAVILAHGDEPWLEEAARAVLASTGVDVDLVLVDNGCTGGAVDRLAHASGVRVLRPAANLGYAGGCRVGAAEATGDYLAFVNSDALVAADALARLVAVAAEPGVGSAMGSIRLADQPDRINTAGNPWHVTGLSWAGGMGRPATEFATRRPVPVASGCCLVLRRDVWSAVGGFAPEYFAYHEDTELSVRLWQRGWTVEYVPDALVLHHYEFSRNPLKSYLLERNRLVLVLTTYRPRTLLLLSPVLVLTEAAMLVTAVAGGWLRPKLRGWVWLWRHRAWLRERRRRVQADRTVSDRRLADLMTARFDPANVEAPAGIGVYNALVGGWWTLVRGLLPRS